LLLLDGFNAIYEDGKWENGEFKSAFVSVKRYGPSLRNTPPVRNER